MRQAGGNARRFAFGHPIDRVMIPAYAANQFAANYSVAAMEREALAACVEHRPHFAIVAAREHEAQSLARVVGVTKHPRATRTHRGHVDGDVVAAVHRCTVRGQGEDEKRGAGCEHQTAENLEHDLTLHGSMLSQRTGGVKARPNPSASLP